MRSKTIKLLLIILLIALISTFVACSGSDDNVKEEVVPTVVSIEIDKDSLPTMIFAGDLDVTQLRLFVTYSDNTKKTVSMTTSMIAVASRTELATSGTKTIKVVYEACETKFQIVLLDKTKVQYALRVYGGVPTAINGVAIEEDIVVEGDYYEAKYDEGTTVTLEWIAIEGYYFDYWTENDKKKDSQSITNVIINGAYTYKAYSEAVINTVSFITNCDTGIGVRRTNYLSESDIPTLTKAGYVFDGWTTTAVTGDSALDNTTVTKISFPYHVNVETTFYALWRILGVGYTPEPRVSQVSDTTGYEILSYSKNDEEVIIPKTHNGYSVIGINENAFSNATKLKRLVLPSTIEYIDEGSFKNCPQLKEIVIDGDSRYFSTTDNILYNYDSTELIAYPAGKLTAVFNVNMGVKEIDSYAFYNALVGGIVLPSTVNEIGAYAFNSVHVDYVDFSSVNPNGIGFELGDNLFNENIKNICLDASYRSTYLSLGQIALFADSVTDDTSELSAIDMNVDKTILYREIYNANSENPSTTTEIIGVARDIKSIIIPVNLRYAVSSIGVEAFNDCVNLTSVSFPIESKLERVCDRAFDDTAWVKTLTNKTIFANNTLYKYLGTDATYVLSDDVRKIAEGAFMNNATLKQLDLSRNINLVYIGAYAFYNCSALTGDTTSIGGGLTLKENLVKIANFSFAKTKLTALRLQVGSKITLIGSEAFADCRYLRTAELSSVLEILESDAFNGCYSLESISTQTSEASLFTAISGVLYKKERTDGNPTILYLYPAGRLAKEFNINDPADTGVDVLAISQINEYAFNFSNIAALYIPKSVTGIGSNAINIPGLIYTRFEKMNGTLTYEGIYSDFATEYIVVTDTSAAESTQNINNFFGNNTTLKDNVLKDAVMDDFSYDAENYLIFSKREGVLSLVKTKRTEIQITVPATATDSLSVTKIGGYAFYGYYLETVRLGGMESSLADYAFYGAKNFTKLFTVENAAIPSIEEHTFNDLFDNGLKIYISYNGANKDNYKLRWSLSNKYLIDLDTELPIASFAGDEIGIIEDIDGTITAENMPKPIRAGYEFLGWRDDTRSIIDVSGVGYEIPYNITLICVWEAKNYTINFEIENNATISQTSYEVTFEKEFEFPVPTMPNMELRGWRTIDGENFLGYGTWNRALTTDCLTLYPIWENKEFKLTYSVTSDVTITNAYKNVIFGENYILDIPTRDGYSFNGWYISTNTLGNPILITSADGSSLLRWSQNGNDEYTVYPVWTNKIVQVNLYLSYASVSDYILYKTVSVEYGQDFTFAFENDYSDITWHKKDIFCGWYDSYDSSVSFGIGKRYTDENGIGLFNWDIGTDTSLYAQWPIEITTGAMLMELTGADLSKSILLKNDIAINKPIGNKDNPYSGLFNGNNKTVTFNYTANAETIAFDGYVGMFAYNMGIIKNVKLNATIMIESTAATAGKALYIGAIAGYNTGIISSSATTGYDITTEISVAVSSSEDTPNVNIGGIVGYNSGEIITLGVRINGLSVTVNNDEYSLSNGYSYNIGNSIGCLADGTLNGEGRSSIYYYLEDDDLFKSAVFGKKLLGNIVAFTPVAAKKS